MDVVRRVSRTPKGGARMVKDRVSKGLEVPDSMASTSTVTSKGMSSNTRGASGHAGDGDFRDGKISPVIKRRRLSDRTNKVTVSKINRVNNKPKEERTPSRKSTPSRMMTPAKVNTRSRASLETALVSPSVEKLLSQEDSFLVEFSEQMVGEEEEVAQQAGQGRVSRASDADMFGVSDEEEESAVDGGIIPSYLAVDSQQIVSSRKTSKQLSDISQLPATGLSSSECSGLPASFYLVKQGALEDLKSYVAPVKQVETPPQSLGRLIDEGRDVGPFHGLPSKVVTLYQQHKRVNELFDWQRACLSTQVF